MIPMLVGSRFRRASVRTPKRSKVWVGSTSGAEVSLAAAGTAFQTMVDEASMETQGKPTIARVRGTWHVADDPSQSTGPALVAVAMGITVVSTKSVAAGIGSLPTPLTNIEWPWLAWDAVIAGTEESAAVPYPAILRDIDSKAMRKVPPASTMIIVFEAGAELAATSHVNIAFAVRILLLPS